jgi:hypothetical protein
MLLSCLLLAGSKTLMSSAKAQLGKVTKLFSRKKKKGTDGGAQASGLSTAPSSDYGSDQEGARLGGVEAIRLLVCQACMREVCRRSAQ